jgi:hypothetical protein
MDIEYHITSPYINRCMMCLHLFMSCWIEAGIVLLRSANGIFA